VFVEYESEVEEERGRVKALLDKLRIEAEVLVFWLSCGQIATYEMIINGTAGTMETENAVNESLKDDDWWDDLRRFRGSQSMSASQELTSIANVMEATSARLGVYNPHASQGSGSDRRRASAVLLADLPRRSTVSRLARLGVNMGIHTQSLPPNVFDDSDTDLGHESDSDSESSDHSGTDVDFNDNESAASEGDLHYLHPARQPLLSHPSRRKSHGDILGTTKEDKNGAGSSSLLWQSYGTMSSKSTLRGTEDSVDPFTPSPPSDEQQSGVRTERVRSPDRLSGKDIKWTIQSSSRLERPPTSRHGSSATKFSSMLVPETRITSDEGSEARITFVGAEASGVRERPTYSRHSSVGRFSSRLVPEMKITSDQEGTGPSVSFAEPEVRSRKNSLSRPTGSGDADIDVAEMVESHSSLRKEDDESGSSYSTQGLPLSFNDLPSRAQHLILNELLRQNSHDTAVLFTTLPIPEEGTCQSEEASVRYLSDIEVLCNDLPPVLLVLSNNMTVTVTL
jgi:potassium/chloride transporter 9